MKARAVRLRVASLVLCWFLLLGASGCVPEDMKLLVDFVEDWARSKDIHPTNPDGSINWSGSFNVAARLAGGSTGDPEADAAIDAGHVIKTIQEADDLMDRGRKERDARAMDQAIAKRPRDPSYRISRAALAAAENDMAAAENQMAALGRADPQPPHLVNHMRQQAIRDYEEAYHRIDGKYQSEHQCRHINETLADLYRNELLVRGDPRSEESAKRYGDNLAKCARVG